MDPSVKSELFLVTQKLQLLSQIYLTPMCSIFSLIKWIIIRFFLRLTAQLKSVRVKENFLRPAIIV